MRWIFKPGNPDNDDAAAPNGYMDSIVIDDMRGEDVGLGYLSDVAVWYADNDVRHGYHIEIRGGAYKGPYALEWDSIIVWFEDCGMVARLREHLISTWGPEGKQLGEIGVRRLDRID